MVKNSFSTPRKHIVPALQKMSGLKLNLTKQNLWIHSVGKMRVLNIETSVTQ
jgi:hypothetical protein